MDIFIPSGIVQNEDIRWQWVTYEKVKQFYQDHKVRVFLFCIISRLVSKPIDVIYPSLQASSTEVRLRTTGEGDP